MARKYSKFLVTLGLLFGLFFGLKLLAQGLPQSSQDGVPSKIEATLPSSFVIDTPTSRVVDLGAMTRMQLWLTAVVSPERLSEFSEGYVFETSSLSSGELANAATMSDGTQFVWKLGDGQYSTVTVVPPNHCKRSVMVNKDGSVSVEREVEDWAECVEELLRNISEDYHDKLFVLSSEKASLIDGGQRVLVGPTPN